MRLLGLFIVLLSLNAIAQCEKIEKEVKVDPFNGDTVIQYETIPIGYAMLRASNYHSRDTIFFYFQFFKSFCMHQDSDVWIKFDNDSTIKTTTLSNTNCASEVLIVANDSMFFEQNIVLIRVYTPDGYIDFDLKPKWQGKYEDYVKCVKSDF